MKGALLFFILLVVNCAWAGSPFTQRRFGNRPGGGNWTGPQYGGTQYSNRNQFDETRSVFDVVYQWKIMDFEYPSEKLRQDAIKSGQFIPRNNLPLGLDVYRNRLFITTPRWNPGTPATLSWLPLPSDPASNSLPLRPYPNWSAHTTPNNPDCSKLMSVYRISVDECGRLWVLDAGLVDTLTNLKQLCQPKIVLFDLKTDQLLLNYELPADQVKSGALFTNIISDVRNGKCDEAFAYVADVWRHSLIVFDLKRRMSWRTESHLYQPNPLACDFSFDNLNFQWSDGIFGTALGPVDDQGDRILFYHPMSSYMEFMVSTAVLRNQTIWQGRGLAKAFQPVGSRGRRGQSSTSGIDRNSVMFYTLVSRDAVGCWDLRKQYTPENIGIVEQDSVKISFPNDLKVDLEPQQGVWALSNALPRFLYASLDYSVTNVRILRADVAAAVAGTICDQNVPSNPPKPPQFEDCFIN